MPSSSGFSPLLRRGRVIRASIVVATAAWIVVEVGCRRGEIVEGVTDSTFVATIAELQRVNADAKIPRNGRQRARDSVLRKHRVSARSLERAAGVLAGDPERAAELWRAIGKYERPDSLPRLRRPGGAPRGAVPSASPPPAASPAPPKTAPAAGPK
jgi:hypothetical protein